MPHLLKICAAGLGSLNAVWLSACTHPAPPAGDQFCASARTPSSAAANPAVGVDPAIESLLLAAGKEYAAWPRVSDYPYVAPEQCRPPTLQGAQRSASADEATHGKKLYYLYIKNSVPWINYALGSDAAGGHPIGKTLVKRSYKAVEVDPKSVPRPATNEREHPEEYCLEGGKAWKIGDAAELFVMTKVDPATPGTDHGWVYAVMAPDGSRVIQAGAIASCMECHTQTKQDRLFGPPWARKRD